MWNLESEAWKVTKIYKYLHGFKTKNDNEKEKENDQWHLGHAASSSP
jgi:hypothetical protein